MVMLAVGTVFGVKVLLKFLPEYFVAFLSPLFNVGSFVILAIAKTKTIAYIGKVHIL